MNILIVDDNDDSRIYLERGLGSQGYTVIVADNGRGALQKLRNCKVDVIISDIMMPVMDGFELCKNVKSDDDLKKIAFIFYTATFTEDNDREFAMSLGASAFIVKPIPPNQFFEIIKDILEDYEDKGLQVCTQIDVDENKLEEQHAKTITRKLEKKIKDLEKEKLALKESEEKFRNIFEQSAVGLAHLTPEGKFLLINKRFSTILGYTLNEPKELDLKDIAHPDYLEAGITNANKLLSNELNTYSVEQRCIRKNGSIVWVYLTVSLVRDENDYPKYFLLVIEDISKRKEDEKEINMLGHAIKSIRESVCVTDLNENVIFVNDAFLHTYGFEREEIQGRPIGTIRSQKNGPEIINSINLA